MFGARRRRAGTLARRTRFLRTPGVHPMLRTAPRKGCRGFPAPLRGVGRTTMNGSVMVVGTASHAGKSVLVTALCRILSRRGVRVAPFKSQNMALNSYVCRDGSEIGRAQVVQAEAAGIELEVDMNPILLKPTNDRQMQVVLHGRIYQTMSAGEYYGQKPFFLE